MRNSSRSGYLPRRSQMAILLVGLVLGSGGLVSAPAAPERLVLRDNGGKVELPPLARASYRDASGKAWALWGEMPGAPEVAEPDFELFLSSQGWRWHTLVSVGNSSKRMKLIGLSRGPRKLMLMLWEAGAGRTGFAIGEDYQETDNAKVKAGGKI